MAYPFTDPSQFVTLPGVPVPVPRTYLPPQPVPVPEPAAPDAIAGATPELPLPIVTRQPDLPVGPSTEPMGPDVTVPAQAPALPGAPGGAGPAPSPQPSQLAAPSAAGPQISIPDQGTGLAFSSLERKKQLLGEEAVARQGESDQIAAAYQEEEKQRAEAEKARAEESKREQEQLAQSRAEVQAATKAFADHKTDQFRLWHNSSTGNKILAGIGVALSGIGAAMKHEGTNPALDIIMRAMDEDVRLQLADREKLSQTIGFKRTALDDLRESIGDKEAQHRAALAALTDRTARQVRAISAQVASPLQKIQADKLAADLDLQAAGLLTEAEQRDWTRRKEAEQLSLQREGMDLDKWRTRQTVAQGWAADQRARDQIDLRRQEMLADADKAAQAARAKMGEEQAKIVTADQKNLQETGIVDPISRELVLQPGGREELDRLATDEKSAIASNPDRAEEVRQAAAIARDEIRRKYALRGRNVDSAAKVGNVMASTATVTNLMDDILRETEGGASLSPEKLARLHTKVLAAQAANKEVLNLGTLDNGTVTFLNEMFGGSAGKVDYKALAEKVGVGSFWAGRREAIKAARDFAVTNAQNMIAAQTVPSLGGGVPKWTPPDASSAPKPKETDVIKAVKRIAGGKTPTEIEAAGKTSPAARTVLKGVGKVFAPLESGSFADVTPRDKAAAAEAGRQTGEFLSREQDRDLFFLASRAGSAEAKRKLLAAAKNDNERTKLALSIAKVSPEEADEARRALVELASKEPRPEVRSGTYRALVELGLEGEAKAAYEAATPEDREAIDLNKQLRSQMATTEISALGDRASKGDAAAVSELARIATSGDPEARALAGAALVRAQRASQGAR